jgi:Cdc6-like AAA superfamily ATPase
MHFLRTHNPFYPLKHSPSKFEFLGKNTILEDINKQVCNFLKEVIPKCLIVIRGGYGSGKTLAVHLTLSKIQAQSQNGEFGRYKY